MEVRKVPSVDTFPSVQMVREAMKDSSNGNKVLVVPTVDTLTFGRRIRESAKFVQED